MHLCQANRVNLGCHIIETALQACLKQVKKINYAWCDNKFNERHVPIQCDVFCFILCFKLLDRHSNNYNVSHEVHVYYTEENMHLSSFI